MATTYSQDNRRIAIETPLGKDVLLLHAFTGEEEMSRLFTFDLDLRSTKDNITPQSIIGKNVSFYVQMFDGSKRYFNGHVQRFAYTGTGDRLSLYRARIVPWLWFLTKTTDCRIFQNKTVPQIIEQVFQDLGFSDFEKSELKGNYAEWEFCVQYRENDFNFVSRLMEQEGIFYYFKHEQGKHTLVLADQKGAYKDAFENQVEFDGTMSVSDQLHGIIRWEHRYEFCTGKFAHTDYNFETPTTNLMSNTNSLVKLDGNTKFEYYEFPGQYEKKNDSEAEAKLRMEEEEVNFDIVEGESYCRSFSPGYKFKLKKHNSKNEQGKGFALVKVTHSAGMGGGFVTGGDAGMTHKIYTNVFTAIPDSVPYRPGRITPKPYLHGTQTAVVVGPPGEEIWPDKYGRVKVQFHWDREGKRDDKSSCWIRVAQPWVGKNWGAIHIPRIGQEVVVSFVEGDVDRPLITGMVYNADNMPPYTLPDNKTQTGIKTRSSKGGTPDNFNEIRFEDLKGEEQLFMHAEKNFDLEVEHDESHWVGHDRKKQIDHDEQVSVGHDRTANVGHDEKNTVGHDRTTNVMRNEMISIGGNLGIDISKNVDFTTGGNRTTSISKDETITVAGKRTETVTKDETIDIQGKRTTTVAKDDNHSIGHKLTFVAGDEIVLQTGSASLVMKKNGDIQIKGANITIQGSGKIGIKATGDLTLKGAKINEN